MFPCAAARHVKCSKIRRAVKCLFTYRRGQERRAGAEPAEIALDQLNDERIRLHVIYQRKVVWHGARKQRLAEVLGQIGMQRIAERIAEHQKRAGGGGAGADTLVVCGVKIVRIGKAARVRKGRAVFCAR